MALGMLFSSDTILSHWRALIVIWFVCCLINTMPSPNGNGVVGSVWYKWLFGFVQALSAGVPRIIATLFPAVANQLPFAQQQNVTAQNRENITQTGRPERPKGDQ
jgi:hypothetical protein